MFLGIYDYTVILTYISLGISVFGITRALEGDFKVAIFCLALSGLCDMFEKRLPEQRRTVRMMRRISGFRSIPYVMWSALVFFRQ